MNDLSPRVVACSRRLLGRIYLGCNDTVVKFSPTMHGGNLYAQALPELSFLDKNPLRLVRSATYQQEQGPRFRVIVADPLDSGLRGNQARLVYAFGVLSLQPHLHQKHILGEAHRLLKASGTLLVQDLVLAPGISHEQATHTRTALRSLLGRSIEPARADELFQTIEKCGLTVMEYGLSRPDILNPLCTMCDIGLRGVLSRVYALLCDPCYRSRTGELRRFFREHRHYCRIAAYVCRA
jgi:hypothetical protein